MKGLPIWRLRSFSFVYSILKSMERTRVIRALQLPFGLVVGFRAGADFLWEGP